MPRYRVELGPLVARWWSIELEASSDRVAELMARNDLVEHANAAELVVHELDDDGADLDLAELTDDELVQRAALDPWGSREGKELQRRRQAAVEPPAPEAST